MPRVIGTLCGSGNLLFEAQKAGCDVVGNIETRSAYHAASWVWEENFKSPLLRDPEGDVDDHWFDADVAIGHPPCGSFSTLGQSTVSRITNMTKEEWHAQRGRKAGLLPQFIGMINRFQPRIFAMDNLIKMLDAYPKAWWEENLPNYQITVLDIVNWDYGSPQTRRRCWIVGTLEDRAFKFRPIKRRPKKAPKNIWEAISDLPWEPWVDLPELAHVHHHANNRAMGSFRIIGGSHPTGAPVGETAFGYLTFPPGALYPYKTAKGKFTRKPGHVRVSMSSRSRTLSKMETVRHPLTGWPLTMRERARLMGWPDDFKLSSPKIKLEQANIRRLSAITGKAVPNEFMRYLLPQLLDHVNA